MKATLSLHIRLTGLLLLLLAALVGVASIYAELRSDDVARRDVDGRLQSSAMLILGTSTPPSSDPASPPFVDESGPESGGHTIVPVYELRMTGGRLISRSVGFPPDMTDAEDGYSDQTGGEREWRVLTMRNAERGLTGRVAISEDETTRLARSVRSDILLPLVAALVVLSITVLGAIWVGLRSLRLIEREIGGLNPLRMRQLEIDADKMPRELSRLTRTLNDLLDRLQNLMRHQKAFISAAGHELRTPLAGCSTQLEVARRSAEPAERDHALTRPEEGLRRMGALVEQLLVIARSEQSSLDAEGASFLLNDLIREIADDLSSAQTKVMFEAESESIRMSGHPDLIASMVANLVQNAIRVSPPGEAVEIRLDNLDDTVRIQVCDRGPGLTPDQKSNIFESFYSGQDGSGPGTGLGLAIVKAVALAHRGEVAIVDREPRGLCMKVILPGSA